MGQLDADALGAFEHGDRRRRARDQPDHGPRGFALRRVGRVDQRVVDDRRAAHVGDAVLRDQLEDLCRIDLAQADIDAGGGRDGPGKAPAVAVEHRQRPEIDRMLAEIARQDVADGVEIGAAVMGDDALGIARGARGVAQRDRVPFVVGQPCDEAGIALRDRRLVFDLADALAAGKGGIVDVDHERFWSVHQRQRFRDHAGKFRIDQDDLRAAMVELEGDRGRIEPDVERVQHRARHRHREMHFVHRGDVRQHRRDRVAVADAAAGETGRKAPAALVGLRPGEAAAFIDRADMVGINGGAAGEETQRRQRHVVRRRLVQSDRVLVLGCAHRLVPSEKLDL